MWKLYADLETYKEFENKIYVNMHIHTRYSKFIAILFVARVLMKKVDPDQIVIYNIMHLFDVFALHDDL